MITDFCVNTALIILIKITESAIRRGIFRNSITTNHNLTLDAKLNNVQYFQYLIYFLLFTMGMFKHSQNWRDSIMNLNASTVSSSCPILSSPPPPICTFVCLLDCFKAYLIHGVTHPDIPESHTFSYSYVVVLFLRQRTPGQLAQEQSPSSSGQ